MLDSRAVTAVSFPYDPHSLPAFEALRALHRDDDQVPRVEPDYEPFRHVWLHPELEGAFVKGVDIALDLHEVHALDGSKRHPRLRVGTVEIEALRIGCSAGDEACGEGQGGEEVFHLPFRACPYGMTHGRFPFQCLVSDPDIPQNGRPGETRYGVRPEAEESGCIAFTGRSSLRAARRYGPCSC